MSRTSDAISEGVSIALAAARLTVRNRILVQTIAQGGTFDEAEVAAFARETLIALAVEQERAAERARLLRRRATGRFSQSGGTHDYRERDTRNLRRRRKQYRGVAALLRARADSDDSIEELVTDARTAAWGDVEANLQRRLTVEAMTPDEDPDYERMRKARMDALRMVDLPRLASHIRNRPPRETSSDQS